MSVVKSRQLGLMVAALALAGCGQSDGGAPGDSAAAVGSEAQSPLPAPAEATNEAAEPVAIASTVKRDGVATLCSAGEIVLFSCQAGDRTISVCGSPDRHGGAQYRAARGGKIELVHPGEGEVGGSSLRRASVPYSGGGEAQIRFDRGGYSYVVFSRVVRTRFDGEGNDPEFTSGVAVVRQDRLVGERLCTDPTDAAVDIAAAEPYMPADEFLYIPEKEDK
ncbi:MAG: hypothetical protein GW859_05230 [Sphingomonadales bacterium]|nr:hypothetical protein [Sphingomonadales bacterium]